MQFTCCWCPYLNLSEISLSLSEAKSTHHVTCIFEYELVI